MGKLLSILSLCALSLGAQASELRLDELQARLGRGDAGWQAGESTVSRLTREEKKRLLGAPLAPANFFARRGKPEREASLPSELDWRNVNGVSYASPILNQGRCGSCVAFAAIATLETQMNITRNTPDSPWAFSPQHLFSCGGGGCGFGWQPSEAVDYLKSSGVPDEACFPYASGALGDDVACGKTCGGAATRSLKLAGSTTPTSDFEDVEAVKRALQHGPLITVMTVYEDFFYYKSGVYKHTAGEIAGGHAISIVGYSDSDRAWVVRNSWGDDWGDNGYFRIAWGDESGLARETWGLDVPGADGYVAIGSLRDHDVLSGVATFTVESTVSASDAIEITISRGDAPVAWAQPIAERHGAGTVTFDTRGYRDGVYTLVATAHKAGGNVTSQPRVVYVLNGELTGSLKFTNVNAGQSLAKSYVFNIDTESSPVPFNRVTFHARNVETGRIVTKATPNVAAKMALNWRMKDLPSGAYDIWLDGTAGKRTAIVSSTIRVRLDNP